MRRRSRKSWPWSFRKAVYEQPCACCGNKYGIQLDHIVPLALGGSDDRSNIQPLCFACNRRKSFRLISNEDLRVEIMAEIADERRRNDEWRAAREAALERRQRRMQVTA